MFCLDPNQLVTLAYAAALALCQDSSADEINTVGNFLVAVGGLMLAFAAQVQFLESLKPSDNPA